MEINDLDMDRLMVQLIPEQTMLAFLVRYSCHKFYHYAGMRPDTYLATANAVICNVTWHSSEILVGTICLTDGAYLHCIAGSSFTQSFSSNNVFFCKFWCFTQPDGENYHLRSVAWNTCMHTSEVPQ